MCLKQMLAVAVLLVVTAASAQQPAVQESFNNTQLALQKTGRGTAVIREGVLLTKDASVCIGEQTWSNYEMSFKARTPQHEAQVQIWAGFRVFNRDDRYIIALRGGLQNNLYLSRRGYMGTDEFLALRTLDFHPEPGKWYHLRIQVCGSRIRVFLNNEPLPRIDIKDPNSTLAPSGKVMLGGGWIHTEFDDLSVRPMTATALDDQPVTEYVAAAADKEKLRRSQRSAYQPVSVQALDATGTKVSLEGNWLFMPSYEGISDAEAASPVIHDDKWHTMHVPDFWNPIRIWLHGETFNGFPKGVSDAYFQGETARCEGYSFNYKKTSAAWYRQWIYLPEGIAQKQTDLVFDAVSKIAEVYINGKPAGKHTGMFGEFRINGKGLFKPGKNLVAVKVIRDYIKDIQDAGKVVDVAVSVEVTNKMLKDLAHGFYNEDPAGIWQPVSLEIKDPLQIADVFIRPSLTGASFDITVKNATMKEQSFSVITTIENGKDAPLYTGEALQQSVVKAGEEKTFTFQVDRLKPRLWSPQSPELYDFSFAIQSNNGVTDRKTISSGFRTFESKNGLLYLNGKPYWLRGGNHTPFALAPNNTALAERFYDLMKAGNLEVTRTHTTPYNERWIAAADRKGVGISFEGTWPWLMINNSMPDKALIGLWADEFISLLKKYRNHPSVLMWTVNNEMKFYDNDPDIDRARIKMQIISEVVKRMRQTDPTRPVCFDSNYKQKGKKEKFGKAFFATIDDGDIDDIHAYINWYDHTLFKQFNGEFQQDNLTPGRPLISQEMSSGYPNAETGHPTRFYTQVHQTGQSLVGDLAYEYSDPAAFLEVQSFITGEQAEAFRRSNDKASGIIHFALLTWFRNVYNEKTIEPYPTYYAMKRALQPVLVSAEIWGRHFYGGEKIPARICVVNDKEDGSLLNASSLSWQLVTEDGKVLAAGKAAVPAVQHYTRKWLSPDIIIPAHLPGGRVQAKLQLRLTENGKEVSANEYNLLLAGKEWVKMSNDGIVLVNMGNLKPALDVLGVHYVQAASVIAALQQPAAVYVFNGLEPGKNCTAGEIEQLRGALAGGKKILFTNAAALATSLFPEYIRGSIQPTEGDIVNMDIPESAVFNGLALLDLRYFNNNQREVPVVCNAALSVQRGPNVQILAKHIKIHGYVNGEMEARAKYMEKIQGATIVQIQQGGTAILSTMSLEKAATDPIPAKLLQNMLTVLLQASKK